MSEQGRAVLPYHHPDDPQYSVAHLTDSEELSLEKKSVLGRRDDLLVHKAHQEIDGRDIHLLYTKNAPDNYIHPFDTTDELAEWFNENIDEDEAHVLMVVHDIFGNIIEKKIENDNPLELYKRMDMGMVPKILNRVEWRQPVPDVGAEFLSRFILAHPMPNTNHRTALALLDRYLASMDPAVSLPDTGSDDEWHDWCADYIYKSKRILTLRRKLPLLRYAHTYGYDAARRKEGTVIDFHEVNLDRTGYTGYYTQKHLENSRQFVTAALEKIEADHLKTVTDDGRRAFIDRLRADL